MKLLITVASHPPSTLVSWKMCTRKRKYFLSKWKCKFKSGIEISEFLDISTRSFTPPPLEKNIKFIFAIHFSIYPTSPMNLSPPRPPSFSHDFHNIRKVTEKKKRCTAPLVVLTFPFFLRPLLYFLQLSLFPMLCVSHFLAAKKKQQQANNSRNHVQMEKKVSWLQSSAVVVVNEHFLLVLTQHTLVTGSKYFWKSSELSHRIL